MTGSTALALQVDWPSSPFGMSLNEGSELPQLIRYLYEWGIALGGLVAFTALLIAGIQFLTSVGNSTKMTEAKDKIQSAIIGLALLLGSWLILYTINPELTTFKPLVMPEPTLFGNCEDGGICKNESGVEYNCNGNEYCRYHFGDDYECENDVCTINLAELFTVTNCDSVSIKKDDGTEKILSLGEILKTIELNPGAGFWLKANPPEGKNQCMASLILYENDGTWGGCGGDKRTLTVQPGVAGYDKFKAVEGVDIPVGCMRLEKF